MLKIDLQLKMSLALIVYSVY